MKIKSTVLLVAAALALSACTKSENTDAAAADAAAAADQAAAAAGDAATAAGDAAAAAGDAAAAATADAAAAATAAASDAAAATEAAATDAAAAAASAKVQKKVRSDFQMFFRLSPMPTLHRNLWVGNFQFPNHVEQSSLIREFALDQRKAHHHNPLGDREWYKRESY